MISILVKAYHIKWAQLKTDANIAKWSVQLIELDQNKRHLDCARLRIFWDTLDQYVSIDFFFVVFSIRFDLDLLQNINQT